MRLWTNVGDREVKAHEPTARSHLGLRLLPGWGHRFRPLEKIDQLIRAPVERPHVAGAHTGAPRPQGLRPRAAPGWTDAFDGRPGQRATKSSRSPSPAPLPASSTRLPGARGTCLASGSRLPTGGGNGSIPPGPTRVNGPDQQQGKAQSQAGHSAGRPSARAETGSPRPRWRGASAPLQRSQQRGHHQAQSQRAPAHPAPSAGEPDGPQANSQLNRADSG